MNADHIGAFIMANLIRQHDASGLWSKDCGCTWHGMARAYIAREAREAEESTCVDRVTPEENQHS